MRENKIIHLRINGTDADYYFGSLAAIYDVYSSDDLGISYASLRNLLARQGDCFRNQICTIKRGTIRRKKQSV